MFIVAMKTGYSLEYIAEMPISVFRDAIQYCIKYTSFEITGEFDLQSESDLMEQLETEYELLELGKKDG